MYSKLFRILCIMVILFTSLIHIPNTSNAKETTRSESEIERFFDEYFSRQMKDKNVPGAGFIIVKDGKPILSKGYGYENLEKKIKVDPENTIFRTASLSKIYVLMSILKLHEDGKIDLDAEVSTYLAADDPLINRVKGVKIKHLLSHTEGFPTKDVGSFVFSEEEIPPIHDTLVKHLQEPTIEPGKGIAYGGMGSVLAAHIIENITGEPFRKYIEKNLQQPLSMDKSTFLQELPSNFKDSLALTYLYEDGAYEETRYLYGVTPPSGGLSSTPADISNLLVALMQNGTFQGKHILKPETVDLMLQPQFRGHENLPGVTYGFFEVIQNNQRALVRDGSGFGVTTRLFYIPEEKIGFVYFQNIRGDELLDDLTITFFDYFYEKDTQLAKTIPLTAEEAKGLEGTYRAVQHHQNILKIGSFMSGMVLDIKANDNGTLQLVVSGDGDTAGWGGFGKETNLTQIEPMLFKRSDKAGYVAFEKNGDTMLMHSGTGYHSTYQEVPWYEKALPQIIFLSLFIVIFLITFIFSMIQVWRRKKSTNSKIEKGFIGLSGITSFLNLAFPYPLFLFGFLTRVEGFPAVAFGIPGTVQILLYVPVITGILALVMAGILFKMVRREDISRSRKIGYVIIVLVSLLFIPFAMYWRIFPGFA